MAHRYFLSQLNNTTAIVSGPEAAHLIKVMRIREGDSVILTDKTGYDYTAIAQEITKDEVIFEVVSKEKNPAEPTVNLTVYMALPKSDKLEFITQKMCELGAARLVPFVSEYCVAQKSKKDDNKVTRLQKISDEACKQSGRSAPMVVEKTATFKEILQQLGNYDKVILFYEHGAEKLSETDFTDCSNVAVIIGSEGGFSEKEAALMVEKGAVNIVLGSRILRCETAAVTGVSLVMFRLGQME
ncbi:MAG: 16S rRNA (uracil(1498)-N(3))-methyltransferase [Oscillospiraceae bacterium]|nr:16S rRNA (uracil(1498)-N(3))-methyltransferase [Oscillospiraceae bacterium]